MYNAFGRTPQKMIEEEQISSEKKANIAVYENDIKHCEETVKLSEKSIADSAQTEKILFSARKI